MNILEKIKSKKEQFIIRSGREPKSIYLGDKEWHYLKIYIMRNFKQKEFTEAAKKGLEICGMKIFHVRANLHLGFGLE